MNILSLFDGMSCGQIALNKAGIKYKNYYSSEIDKYAQIVSKANYPNTIYLGDVRKIDVSQLEDIDLIIGGSPCQSFSFAGKRKGMSTKCEIEITSLDQYIELKSNEFEFQGQSYLFWEYMRVLEGVRKKNPKVKFFLENVLMTNKWQKILTAAIGVRPIFLDSALVSAQVRRRLYWTNIGHVAKGLFDDATSEIETPKDQNVFLKDILQEEVEEKYFLSERFLSSLKKWEERNSDKGNGFKAEVRDGEGKSATLSTGATKSSSTYIIQKAQGANTGGVFYEKSPTLTSSSWQNNNTLRLRKLTPIEFERLQTVPDNYTNYVSDSQRYKMLGNGWTVDIIAHIFKYLN